MKIRKWILFLICLSMLSFQISIPVSAEGDVVEEPGELYAKAAVLMDADTGRVLFGKDELQKKPMASTTKIMTCILALEQSDPEAVMEVSKNASEQPKVKLGATEKETFQLKDLLYSLMLESHNDSAVIIAENIAGSVEAFADKMNEKARDLNCNDTYFVTPNGLDGFDEGGTHSTTARDLALIMKYCINDSPQKETFLEITRTKNYSFSNLEGTRSYSCTNHNAFLDMMEGALSGKTGFTGDAGYCYVGALRQGDRTFIVALLACGWPNNKGYKWKDSRTLFQYGIDNYGIQKLWKEEALSDIPVKNAVEERAPFDQAKSVPVVVKTAEPDWEMLLRNDETVIIEKDIRKHLSAPVKKGDLVGELRYCLNGETLKRYQVVAAKDIKERDLSWCLKIIIKKFLSGNVCAT